MTSNKDKIEAINRYLEDDYMLIHFDARRSGIQLPEHLMKNPTVTLKLSYKFKGGLEVTEERIWASLLFSGKPHDCFIPIGAIWGTTSCSGANTIWPDDAPPEVMAQVIQSLATTEQAPNPKSSNISIKGVPKAGSLKGIKSVRKPRKSATAKSKKGSRPSHLKRIK